jgi:OTU domain-containing protein 6
MLVCSSLYCAVDDQLKLHGDVGLGIEKLRQMTSQYLKEHRSDFLPFLSSTDTGDLLNDEQYEEYCNEVANTSAWGGEVEVSSHIIFIIQNGQENSYHL